MSHTETETKTASEISRLLFGKHASDFLQNCCQNTFSGETLTEDSACRIIRNVTLQKLEAWRQPPVSL